MDIQFQIVEGRDLEPWFDSLAQLRIEVFEEFPYLYNGDMENERDYLSTYLKTPSCRVILAKDSENVIGASTCIRMDDEVKEIRMPFEEKGFNLDRVVYFGESIIKSQYRGHKIGHYFFKERERQAIEICTNLQWTTFCAVERPEDHPLRPKNYRPLHQFWSRMGYEKSNDMTAFLEWKDVGEDQKTAKPLKFWLKSQVDQ